MDELVVTTTVYLPPEEVYDFLLDFPRYARYSEYLTDVAQDGDGAPGTRYDLRFAWWKLSYTARSEVTAVDPPRRIDWRIVKDLRATGRWALAPTDPPADAPDSVAVATTVRFEVAYDSESADRGAVDLPRIVSLDWVVEKVKPLIRREAERIVERVVADLEGRRRPVDLTVETRTHEGK